MPLVWSKESLLGQPAAVYPQAHILLSDSFQKKLLVCGGVHMPGGGEGGVCTCLYVGGMQVHTVSWMCVYMCIYES